MSVTFRIVRENEVALAHEWHRGFAAANDALYPRKKSDFIDLVFDNAIWCAVNSDNEFLGLAYADFDQEENTFEVGGLMVAAQTRGKGLGSVLLRLPLAQLLFEEDPFAWDTPPKIVAHVLEGNDAPRGIVRSMGFEHSKNVKIPSEVLPGLKCDEDGYVRGTEFELGLPKSLSLLAKWAGNWSGMLRDGSPARIHFLKGRNENLWATAFSEMAAKVSL